MAVDVTFLVFLSPFFRDSGQETSAVRDRLEQRSHPIQVNQVRDQFIRLLSDHEILQSKNEKKLSL
jgi:hypothetical protein